MEPACGRLRRRAAQHQGFQDVCARAGQLEQRVRTPSARAQRGFGASATFAQGRPSKAARKDAFGDGAARGFGIFAGLAPGQQAKAPREDAYGGRGISAVSGPSRCLRRDRRGKSGA